MDNNPDDRILYCDNGGQNFDEFHSMSAKQDCLIFYPLF